MVRPIGLEKKKALHTYEANLKKKKKEYCIYKEHVRHYCWISTYTTDNKVSGYTALSLSNIWWFCYYCCLTRTNKYVATNQFKLKQSKHQRWLTYQSHTTETRHLLPHSSPHPMLINRLESAPTAISCQQIVSTVVQ